MDDPSQSAAQAASRQDRALQEKHRAKIQAGALTGLAERNTKWDVEYEGKDAKGQLVRPFEPGFGDSRPLPDKMLGEDISAAVARSMGRSMPHSGAGDGIHRFKTDFSDEKLSQMRAASTKAHSPPPAMTKNKKAEKKAVEQQRRLEEQWAVGLTGGSYGMHTRHVVTQPPSPGKKSVHATLGREPPGIQAAHNLGLTPESGPPETPAAAYCAKGSEYKPVLEDNKFDLSTAYCRSPSGKLHKTVDVLAASNGDGTYDSPILRMRGDAGHKVSVNQGAHAMLDRMGPNIASGPIPRDGFTTDAYEAYSRKKLHELGYSDVRGEHGERPDELINGIDHLDKLEHLGPSGKDKKYVTGFTGNTALLMGGAKVNVGRGATAK